MMEIEDGIHKGRIRRIVTEDLPGVGQRIDFEIEVETSGGRIETITKRYHVTSDAAARMLKKELSNLGVTVACGAEFERRIAEIEGMLIEFSARTSEDGCYQSYYCTRKIDPVPPPPPPPPPPSKKRFSW